MSPYLFTCLLLNFFFAFFCFVTVSEAPVVVVTKKKYESFNPNEKTDQEKKEEVRLGKNSFKKQENKHVFAVEELLA